jgi:hypothetical protein
MWATLVIGIWVADLETVGLKNGGEITIKECFKLRIQDLNRGCVVGYGMVQLNTMNGQ